MASSSNPQPQEQLWEWKRPECKREGARITLYNNESVLKDIETKLLRVGSGPSLLNRFLDGCFGHLLAWRGGISCGKALHELLAHEIKIRGSPSDQYWFRICGQNLRFYYPEFALVSGLSFGTSEFDPTAPHKPEETQAYKLFYNGYRGRVNMKDLLTKFKNCSEDVDVDPTGVSFLKVANILALYYFVLGYRETEMVDSFAWVLVDNLEAWNEFPWGAYSYQAFTHYMSLLPNTKAECREIYSFYGPAWVLQKWSYEAIPDLGEKVAMQMVTVDYTSLFEQQSEECEQFLEPEEDDVKSVHWLSVLTDSPLGVKYIAPRILIRLRRAESIAVSEGDHKIKRRGEGKEASGIEGKKRMTEKGKQRKKSVLNIDEESDWEVQMKKKRKKGMHIVQNESLACRSQHQDNQFTMLDDQVRMPTSTNTVDKVNEMMMTGGADGAPMMGMAVRKKLFESTSSKKYDQLELSYKINELEKFSASLEEKIKSKFPLEITLPLKAKNVAKVGWFDSILQRTGWLGDEHVDALLNLIIFKANIGYEFLSDWTILESLGTVNLNQENFEKTNGPIMKYVDGLYPIEGPKSWVDARRVLGVANINQSHWVCYEIILENQLIMVYDSMTSKMSWSKVVKALHNMTKYLPKLCKKAGIWEKKGLTTVLKDHWDLELFKDTPQQVNGSDCGIMSIKCIECLVSGIPVTTIDPNQCGVFRKIYCYQLYHMGLSCPAP